MTGELNCARCQTPLPAHSRYCLNCGSSITGEGAGTADFDPRLHSQLQQELGSEYLVEKELGRGGMAAVYLAQDTRLGRRVAIKVLPPAVTFGRADTVERFRREARTAATLDHPHIIPIYRVSGDGRLVWYVMKYLQGESLDRLLQRVWQLSIDATVRIIEQVAAALQHAHELGVVHRDVKPANAMIDHKGWVTVTDFGIAKAMDAEALTGTGSAIGTPFYMSPEQCSGQTVTGASDQYALGIMTYQMLAGRVPFTGPNIVDIIRRHCFDKVPSLTELRPEITPAVAQVIERALAKKASERFASVTSFATALSLTSRGVDIGASYSAKGDPMHAAETVIINEPVIERRAKPRLSLATRRSRRFAAAAAVGLVAVGAGGLATWRPWAAPSLPQDSVGQPIVVMAPAPVPADTSRPAADTHRPATQRPVREQAEPVALTPQRAPAESTRISVGSRPSSQITINGRGPLASPVVDYPVAVGAVRLRFQVTDTLGPWRFDTVVTARAGEPLRLGFLTLTRPVP